MKTFAIFGIIWIALYSASSVAQHPIDVARADAEGEHLQALVIFEKLPERRRNDTAREAAAHSAWALGLVNKASAEFDRLLSNKNLDPEAKARFLFSKAVIEFQEKRFDVGQLFADRARELLSGPSPLRGNIDLLLSQIWLRLNNPATALETAQSALEQIPATAAGDALFAIASAEIQLGKKDSAITHLQAIPLDHERASDAIRHLGEIYADKNDLKEASFWLSEGRKRFPQAFLDGWVDFVLLKATVATKGASQLPAELKRINETYPASDPWLTLMNAMAEGFYGRQNSKTASGISGDQEGQL